jgi:hypothetical protein
VFTYNPCLLYNHGNPGFGLVGLQTNNILFLKDQLFATAKELQLKNIRLMAKQREKLTIKTLLKFNSGYITLNTDGSITFNQPRQCENLSLVNIKNVNIISSRGKKRTSVTPKDQYVAQQARGAYIASVCQPKSSFNLSFAA